jgi:hypothetical protein
MKMFDLGDMKAEVRPYRLRVVTNKKLRSQKHHVQILARNGNVLFWSENYSNRLYAEALAHEFARMLNVSVTE